MIDCAFRFIFYSYVRYLYEPIAVLGNLSSYSSLPPLPLPLKESGVLNLPRSISFFKIIYWRCSRYSAVIDYSSKDASCARINWSCSFYWVSSEWLLLSWFVLFYVSYRAFEIFFRFATMLDLLKSLTLIKPGLFSYICALPKLLCIKLFLDSLILMLFLARSYSVAWVEENPCSNKSLSNRGFLSVYWIILETLIWLLWVF